MRSFIILFLLTFVSLQLYSQPHLLVFLHKNPDAPQLPKEEVERIMSGHMDNINRLAKEGKLVAAGPFEGGGGLFILNAATPREAYAWLEADPGIKAKRWNLEFFEYKPRTGAVCSVGEPYEMVMYSFVRFDFVVSKFTASDHPQIIKQHNDYLQQLNSTGNVVAESPLGEDAGMLVMKGEVNEDIFNNDPGVQQGLVELKLRKLYIAKGSFCEK